MPQVVFRWLTWRGLQTEGTTLWVLQLLSCSNRKSIHYYWISLITSIKSSGLLGAFIMGSLLQMTVTQYNIIWAASSLILHNYPSHVSFHVFYTEILRGRSGGGQGWFYLNTDSLKQIAWIYLNIPTTAYEAYLVSLVLWRWEALMKHWKTVSSF